MDAPAQQETLKEQMTHIIGEARMLLPGIQAMFGFQTIAVFNQRFEHLPGALQLCHAAALALVVLAIGLVMLPAAYHRLAEPGRTSRRTVAVSSRALAWALAALAAGLALDIAVVLYLIAGNAGASAAGGAAALVLLLAMWFVYPLAARRIIERLTKND